MSVKVFTNANICSQIVSYLPLREQRRCLGTNQGMKQGCDKQYPQTYKRIARKIPQNMIEQIGIEHFKHAQIMFYPKEAYGRKFSDFAVPIGPCKGDHLTIGIGKDEDELFIGVRVNFVAKGRLCGSLVVKSTVQFVSIYDPCRPTALYLMQRYLEGTVLPDHTFSEEPRRCCFSTRLFELLRRCFFKTVYCFSQLA